MAILVVQNICKHFDGVEALSDVNVAFEPGEVHALIGENGAGKSTLGKIIAGVVRPSSGVLLLDGKPIEINDAMQAQKLGIGMIFQELDLFPNLNVGENIAVGNLALASGPFVDFRKLERQVRPFLNQVELHVRSDVVLGELSMAQQQLVAIARALSMNARLIVMDEPTSSLTRDAVSRLFGLIRKLSRQGVAIVYVSHKMDEIFQIADRVTVLRDGRHIGTKLCADTNVDGLIRMMVGRDVPSQRRRVELSVKSVLLSVQNLTTRKLINVSFDLHAGEVLGVAGLVGAGRSELGEALFGLDRIIAGTVTKSGRIISPTSPRVAMRQGIGLLPEDRKCQGLMMQMSVRENASIATLHNLQSSGFIRFGEEAKRVAAVNQRTRVKAAFPQVAIHTLSGGNQQKVLLARWLLADSDVLFLDDPTRGVDIVAKFDIYELIAEMSGAGKGVILVSSELPELLQCCDRIMVLREGRLAGIRNAFGAAQEELMSLASVSADEAQIESGLPMAELRSRSVLDRLKDIQGVIGLVVICIVATIVSPRDSAGQPIFINHVNLTNIVRQVSETGIIALSMTFVILSAGIDLSVGSLLALGATLCAKLLSDWEPSLGSTSQMAAAGLLAIAACGLVGAASGIVIAYARIQPFVVTLAAMIGIRGLAKWMTENKNIGLGFGTESVSGQFAATFSQKSVVIGTFAVLVVIFAVVLNRTVFGRYIRAIGDNAKAAMYAGLPIRAVQIAVYAISGLMAGLAGVLHAAQNHQGNPNDGIAYELDAIAAVVIGGTPLSGGKGSMLGTVIGTLIMGVITNIMGLRGWDENVKWMAKAVIIIAAVLFQQTMLLSRLRWPWGAVKPTSSSSHRGN